MKHSRTFWMALLAAGIMLHEARGAEDLRPRLEDEVKFEQKLNVQVPLDIEFRNEEGRTAPLADYIGDKPVVLSLVYYECPMLCNLTLNGMVDAFKALPFDIGNQFDVWTVSFDPEETHVLAAAKKDNYLEAYGRAGAENGWRFFVGDEVAIGKLTSTVGFGYKYLPEADEYSHRSGIILLTPEGKVSHYFPGMQFDPRDLRLGLVEASDGKIGSAVDKLFLLCYHYDPAVGKYGLVIQNVINIGCFITVAALGIFLFVMFRRERAHASGGKMAEGRGVSG